MFKIVMLIALSINLFGEVDIIIDSFDTLQKAQNAKKRLEKVVKENNLSPNIKIEKIGDIFYIKMGSFSQSIRDDKTLLMLFASNYPNMVIVPHPKATSKNRSSKNIKKESIISENSSTIQWIIIVIMTIWAGVILFLRFKRTKEIKKEQKIITNQQDSMEITLNQTKEGKK